MCRPSLQGLKGFSSSGREGKVRSRIGSRGRFSELQVGDERLGRRLLTDEIANSIGLKKRSAL